MFHTSFPVIAFCENMPPYSPIPFIDCDELGEGFHEHTVFRAIPASELDKHLTADHYAQLLDDEKQYVRDWRSMTVAEVIFNDWA